MSVHDSLIAALRLYLVADPDHIPGDPVEVVAAAISGGVSMVQVRVKGRSDREFLELAMGLGEVCRVSGIPMIINDRIDIALASGASGIHLGVDDLPLEAARSLGGPNFIIGYSPETDIQTEAARSLGADYLGVGPVFGTRTKDDAGSAIGLGAITLRAELSGCPIIGIGGVTSDNARSVVDSGAVGVAVVSAITRSADPTVAARSIRDALDS